MTNAITEQQIKDAGKGIAEALAELQRLAPDDWQQVVARLHAGRVTYPANATHVAPIRILRNTLTASIDLPLITESLGETPAGVELRRMSCRACGSEYVGAPIQGYDPMCADCWDSGEYGTKPDTDATSEQPYTGGVDIKPTKCSTCGERIEATFKAYLTFVPNEAAGGSRAEWDITSEDARCYCADDHSTEDEQSSDENQLTCPERVCDQLTALANALPTLVELKANYKRVCEAEENDPKYSAREAAEERSDIIDDIGSIVLDLLS